MELYLLGAICILSLVLIGLLVWVNHLHNTTRAIILWSQELPKVVQEHAEAISREVAVQNMSLQELRLETQLREISRLLPDLHGALSRTTAQLEAYTKYGISHQAEMDIANYETADRPAVRVASEVPVLVDTKGQPNTSVPLALGTVSSASDGIHPLVW